MTKSVDYDNFNSFDLNEACDYFDPSDQRVWKKINQFVVADGQEFVQVMEQEFDFEDTTDGEYVAFSSGIQYAMTKLNAAFEAAGIELEICEADLGESMGFMLTRVDDTPGSFVQRVLKKPVKIVEGWV